MNKWRQLPSLRLCRRTSTKHSLQTGDLLLFLNHQALGNRRGTDWMFTSHLTLSNLPSATCSGVVERK
jgi:hypothetical protein